jgi:hypothetical protein
MFGGSARFIFYLGRQLCVAFWCGLLMQRATRPVIVCRYNDLSYSRKRLLLLKFIDEAALDPMFTRESFAVAQQSGYRW